ncbi:MAG TPA: SsrA-binding protein SmpB [Myxococcota bacterium]|nr:SsrA-binding protein SmpB [Myxococcota bacterium]HQK51416.1 SsrA-binding protein SmpB [Myxococcota bacterium]
MGKDRQQAGRKVVAENRRARHDYELLERLEAGLVLLGSEVKSLRQGGMQLVDSYGEIVDGEVFLVGARIAPYAAASYQNHDPTRRRKLLLHRAEIRRLDGKVRQKGLTLVPLSVYFQSGRAKVEIALARGRKAYDKRERILQRDRDRVREE